jgi:hypothetical protein
VVQVSDLPKQIAESTLTIMGVELTVAVLDNGQRLIVGDGLERLFEAMADGAPLSSDDAMKLAKIVR